MPQTSWPEYQSQTAWGLLCLFFTPSSAAFLLFPSYFLGPSPDVALFGHISVGSRPVKEHRLWCHALFKGRIHENRVERSVLWSHFKARVWDCSWLSFMAQQSVSWADDHIHFQCWQTCHFEKVHGAGYYFFRKYAICFSNLAWSSQTLSDFQCCLEWLAVISETKGEFSVRLLVLVEWSMVPLWAGLKRW